MSQTQVDKPAFDHESKHEIATPMVVDSETEKKLLRKCDLALIPPLMVIYFLSFMDRTNIGEHCQPMQALIMHTLGPSSDLS